MPSKRQKSKSDSTRARKKASRKPKTRARKSTPKEAKTLVQPSASAAKARTARAMSIAADQQLGADQVAQILAECIPRAGGNDNEIVLSKTLQSYGFHFQNQVDTLTSFIIGDADLGVRKYGFRLSGDALNFATPTTMLSDLADAIQDKAIPAP